MAPKTPASTPRSFSELLDRYGDYGARATAVYGLNPLLGRIWSILILAPEPMTLDQLTGATGAAKSTLSVAMRNLEKYRVVERRFLKGDRRVFFSPRVDLVGILQDWYHLFMQHELRYMEEANATALEALRGSEGGDWPPPERRAEITDRLERLARQMEAARTWLERLVEMDPKDELPAARPAQPAARIPVDIDTKEGEIP